MRQGEWMLWLAAAIAVALSAVYGFYFFEKTKFGITVMVTNGLALIFVPILCYLAFHAQRTSQAPPHATTVNLFAIVIGMLAGWALSIFWVPYDSVDAKIYTQIGTAVTFAISGYLFAKFDKVISQAWGAPAEPVPPHLVHAVLLGFSTWALTAIVITTNRIDYLQQIDRDDKEREERAVAGERKAHDELTLAAAKHQVAIRALIAASREHPRSKELRPTMAASATVPSPSK